MTARLALPTLILRGAAVLSGAALLAGCAATPAAPADADTPAGATADIFRVDDGLIREHWDVVPTTGG